jgi:hypothetical protein
MCLNDTYPEEILDLANIDEHDVRYFPDRDYLVWR